MNIAAEWLRYAPKPRPLGPDEQWHVFLSYRSVNRPWVLNLYDVLRNLGYTVFLDQVVLKAGDALVGRLEVGLRSSQAGVLVWSSAAADSDWVRREYEAMENMSTERKSFAFVPVRLDTQKLPLFAASRVFLDFLDYPDGPNGGELLRLLHAVVGRPLSEEAAHFALLQDEAAKAEANRIEAAIANGNARRLVELFDANGLPWQASAALGCRVADGLIGLDKYDDAIRILTTLEAQFPKAIRPRQLHALALARRAQKTGQTVQLEAAQEILAELYAAGQRDPETLGIYGRTWMDRYRLNGDLRALRRSRDLYAEGFAGARDDSYTGINSAAKSVLLGGEDNLKRAEQVAADVLEITGTDSRHGDYWTKATIAEALLICRRWAEAAKMYEDAVAKEPESVGSHRSTCGQAKLLLRSLGVDEATQQLVLRGFAHLS